LGRPPVGRLGRPGRPPPGRPGGLGSPPPGRLGGLGRPPVGRLGRPGELPGLGRLGRPGTLDVLGRPPPTGRPVLRSRIPSAVDGVKHAWIPLLDALTEPVPAHEVMLPPPLGAPSGEVGTDDGRPGVFSQFFADEWAAECGGAAP
jgi:hypothetical protein